MYAFFRFFHNHRLALSYCLAVVSSSAHALDFLDGQLQVHGFLSQGMVKTSANNFMGDSHNVSFDFREIALNTSYRALSNLQFSAQVMSHFAGASDTGMVDADYAFVDWTIASGEWGRGGIRAGRVKNPFGLYNTTRFVPFARPSIILPQSIYFERTRKVAVSSDGVELYFDWLSDWGTFGADVVLGFPEADDKATELAVLGRDFLGKPSSEFTQLYQVNFESADQRWRLSATSANVNYTYIPGTNDPIRAGQSEFTPYIFSVQYEAEKWSLTAEYAIRPLRGYGFGAFLDRKAIGESFYIQGTYTVLPKVEVLARYDVAYLNRDDKDGISYAKLTGKPGFTQFSKDLTLGVRYDVTSSFMLRAEYHNVDGTAILPGLDNPDPATLERHWDMWMLLGSIRF